MADSKAPMYDSGVNSATMTRVSQPSSPAASLNIPVTSVQIGSGQVIAAATLPAGAFLLRFAGWLACGSDWYLSTSACAAALTSASMLPEDSEPPPPVLHPVSASAARSSPTESDFVVVFTGSPIWWGALQLHSGE